MKRFLTTTAFIVATSGAALAGSHMTPDQLRMSVADYFATSEFSVDIDSLTTEQLVAIEAAISSSDDQSEKLKKVRAVLNDSNVMMTERELEIMVPTPRDQIYVSVKNALEGTEYEGQAAFLTDEELTAAYLAINSTDDQGEKMKKLAALFN